MNAAWVCLAGLVVFVLGYRFYAKFLAEKVFQLRDDEPVPSVEQEDGVDFVPTDRHVLLGHHYASIAGAAPIIGPAIAVVWGWVPAVAWVVLGTVFMGAVHDFSTLVISIRHRGRSIGQITADVLGPRTRAMFLLVIFVLIMVVIAVFAKAIATLFIKQPGTVIPINFEIIIALVIGWACTRKKIPLLWPSIAALIALYAMVWVGTEFPVRLLMGAEGFAIGGYVVSESTLWVVVLLIYSFIASVLPVWVLLQPRDFINSHQLVVGLAALIAGIFVARPEIVAPAINDAPPDSPAWFPFLFVTIACGAISGFHGLVSSGTTSKQIKRATDARLIGYGGMIGEGVLALIATLAVSAGISDWAGHYDSFSSAAKGGIVAFVLGAATFLEGIGIPRDPAQVVVAVLVISFAATSLDTGVRIQRYIVAEFGEIYRQPWLQNRYVGSALAVLPALVLVLAGQERALWPIFGASNQLLAGLSLVIVTVWLIQTRRPWWFVGIPMVLVLAIAGTSIGLNTAANFAADNYLLTCFSAVTLALQLWIVVEGVLAVIAARRNTT